MRHLPALVAFLFAGFAEAQDHLHYTGAWQGPMLFYVAQQDLGATGPPAVYPGTLQIDSDGRVRGLVPDAACAIAGSGIDYVSPANASLDLTFSGCRDIRFNGQFSGKLINNPILKYASMRLRSMQALDQGTAQVSAIMRR